MFSKIIFIGFIYAATLQCLKQNGDVHAAPTDKQSTHAQAIPPIPERTGEQITAQSDGNINGAQTPPPIQEPNPILKKEKSNLHQYAAPIQNAAVPSIPKTTGPQPEGTNDAQPQTEDPNSVPKTQTSIVDQIKAAQDFFQISKAFGPLLPSIRSEIKNFLLGIIPRMPRYNVVKQHFVNGLTALQLFEAFQHLHLNPVEQKTFNQDPLAIYRAHASEINEEMGRGWFQNRITAIPPSAFILSAFDELSPQLRAEIKNFLTTIIPQMPGENAVTEHFKGSLEALQLYDANAFFSNPGMATANDDPGTVLRFLRTQNVAWNLRKEIAEVGDFVSSADQKLPTKGTRVRDDEEYPYQGLQKVKASIPM